jgi:acetoin utilization protein AcuB
MLVGERMTRNPITTTPETTVSDALYLMRREKVRRLPVLDRPHGKLVGIVTDKDLLNASPSAATSLSVWEINYLLARLTVAEVMTKNVVVVRENEALEDAARIMADNKIGSLPVIRGDTLVGIITDTDLFKIFIELFAAREKGVRLSMLVPSVKGELAKITAAITELGGNILALGTFLGEDPTNALCTVKVEDVPAADLVDALTPLVQEIVDVREA